MKLRYILATVAATFALNANAQNLGEQELTQLKESFVKDAQTIATQNILTGDKNIKAKTKNHAIAGSYDHFFKYRVNVKGITDQQSSGRCWMFTSMNALRPIVMEKYNVSKFDFSHNYNYFWDILEKSNLYLENMIRTADKDINCEEVVFYLKSPVNDGGVWNLFY
ncbi:MAG: C1 family peptidase, partial [Bacteroidia bacterium]|nr:C1 family peptidase [Bacteroidia bacterium]